MKRNDFLKNAVIALSAIPLTMLDGNSTVQSEDIKFITSYLDKYVDLSDIPDELDLAEKALTAYIRGELSKTAVVKILIFTDGMTEMEAIQEIKEIDEMREEDKVDYEDLYGIDDGQITVPYGFAD